jgi:hypothetical protein
VIVDDAILRSWTPVALRFDPAPAIDWMDLGQHRFTEPFFDQTIARLSHNAIVTTGLDALLACDDADSLEPDGIIFHFSRCGSTLVSRLLGTVPGTLVLSEPAPLNALLQLDPARVDPEIQIRVARLLVRAMARVRLGDERRLVLKCSSWNIRRAEVLQAAFPAAKRIWVQRAPLDVVASLLTGRPGWLRLEAHPAVAETLFGIVAASVPTMDPAEFCIRALRAMLESAAATDVSILDYRQLPGAVWMILAPMLGIDLTQDVIDRMRREAEFSAKQPGAVPFVARAHDRLQIDETIINSVAALLDPLYQALANRGGA